LVWTCARPGIYAEAWAEEGSRAGDGEDTNDTDADTHDDRRNRHDHSILSGNRWKSKNRTRHSHQPRSRHDPIDPGLTRHRPAPLVRPPPAHPLSSRHLGRNGDLHCFAPLEVELLAVGVGVDTPATDLSHAGVAIAGSESGSILRFFDYPPLPSFQSTPSSLSVWAAGHAQQLRLPVMHKLHRQMSLGPERNCCWSL